MPGNVCRRALSAEAVVWEGRGVRDERGDKRVIRLRPRPVLRMGGMLLPLLLLLPRLVFGRVSMMRRTAVVMMVAVGVDVEVGEALMALGIGGLGRDGRA